MAIKDKRLYNVRLTDCLLTYLDGHPMPAPFKYTQALGPFSISEENVKELDPHSEAESNRYNPITTQQELSYLLGSTKQNANVSENGGVRNPQYGNTLGQVTFKLATLQRMGWRGVEWGSYGGLLAMPVADIESRSFQSAIDLGVFEPAALGNETITSFRYRGKKPLHTVIQGSVTVHAKEYSETSSATRILYLDPAAAAPTAVATSLTNGHVILGTCVAAFNPEPAKLRARTWPMSDELKPPIDSDVQTLINNPDRYPNLYNGSVNAVIVPVPPANAVTELRGWDVTLADPLVSTSKTTNPILIKGGDIYLVWSPSGKTNRCVIEFTGGGRKLYESYAHGCQGYIRTPVGATEMRIYHMGENPMPIEAPGDFLYVINRNALGNVDAIDPNEGWWTKLQFHVNQPVTFYPGAVYCFGIHTIQTLGEPKSVTADSFRIESGGLSCLFDTTPFIDELVKSLVIDEDI